MALILHEDFQAEDSEDLSEEQEQWFKERMAASTWGRPYKPWPEVVFRLKWVDREEGRL